MMEEMKVFLVKTVRDEKGFAGAWFSCPVNFEEVMEKLGIENEEEFEIADYELPFPVRWNIPLWELNMNCSIAQSMESTPIGAEMKAIIGKWFGGFDDFMDHKEDICYYAVQDPEALARCLLLEEHVCGEIPDKIRDYIDYVAYGRDLETDDHYLFTSGGVFYY